MAGRSRLADGLLVAIGLLFVGVFVALGTWQVHRRAWKLDLIARVEGRIHAAPVPAPPAAAWPGISAERDEYRRVSATGVYLPDHVTLVHALTVAGAGFWVMAPFRTSAGDLVLVNRGFVPLDHPPIPEPAGETTVTGLLRMSEPGGTILRRNDPAANTWYGRDTTALAAARGLGPVAPFFIDADAGEGGPGAPRGGLTVVDFPNNHLSYAITWYALGLMTAGVIVWRAFVWRTPPR